VCASPVKSGRGRSTAMDRYNAELNLLIWAVLLLIALLQR
jgi:hypothetical protein